MKPVPPLRTTFRRLRTAFPACAALLVALATPAAAQEHPISWTLGRVPHQLRQGETARIALTATIPFGWHLYSMTQPPGGPTRMELTIPEGNPFTLAGKVSAPDPAVAPDNNFAILTETYTDSATFIVPVVAREAGKEKLQLRVAYQTCTDRYCLPPTADLLEATVTVSAVADRSGAPPAATVREAAPPPPPPPVVAATPTPEMKAAPPVATPTAAIPTGAGTTASLPLFLWLAAVMGAVSLLTPCVFPMIPITVSYFTRTNETTRRSPARNALVYAVGIMATFTLLGMAIAVLVGAGGINRFAANPWINLLVTAIFVAFAFNLFGAWELTVPSGLLTRLDAASRHSGRGETFGILAMGLTFTLTSFTCTAPFVGTLLVMAAQGSWEWPLLGLLVFSAVFALPFFVLALMPSAIARLPRSGAWLTRVKVVMGFIELATAMKFLANADLIFRWGVITRDVVLWVWMAVAAATALYLAGAFSRQRPRPRLPVIQYLLAAAVVLIAVALGRGLRGGRLGELESFLPPPEGIVTSGTTEVAGELSWMVNDLDGALRRARAEHKAVMVDFTGYTCTNCRWMEANMFPRPAIKAALGGFVRVRLYTDGQGELYRQQQQFELTKFGTVALPYYAVLDSTGETRSQFLGMTRNTEEFLQFLQPTASR